MSVLAVSRIGNLRRCARCRRCQLQRRIWSDCRSDRPEWRRQIDLLQYLEWPDFDPTSGSVIFNGFEIAGGHPRENCRLGIGRTFQVPETYGSMTVCENVQMVYVSKHRTSFNPWLPVGRLYRDEAMAVLERIGIASQAQLPASVLAYGDVKRLELAIAIASDPILLLMDEPAAGMSPAERIDLMKLTDSLVRERNLAVLFTEHSMDVVFAYAHHILVLSRGKLIASGTPASVRDNHEVQEVYLGSSAFLDLSGTAVT